MADKTTDAGMQTTANQPGCSPETNLWLAVVQEVISTEPVDAAQRWLRSGDGRMVAAMAGVDADWVADRIVPDAARRPATRKRRCTRQQSTFGSRGQRRPPLANEWALSWGA